MVQQRVEELALRLQAEFNALQSGAKPVEMADRLSDGAAGTTVGEITTSRDGAIAAAVLALTDGAPATGDTLGKLFALINTIAASGYATTADVNTAISAVIGAAPEALNTLEELAAAFGNDANAVSSLVASIATKANSADVYTKAESDAEFINQAELDAALGNPNVDLVAIFETGLQ
jgi:hypothetical protein